MALIESGICRVVSCVLGALMHFSMFLFGIDAFICALKCDDVALIVLACLSLMMGIVGAALNTFVLYHSRDVLQHLNDEQILSRRASKVILRSITYVAVAGIDFYLASRMKEHHFKVFAVATTSWILTLLDLTATVMSVCYAWRSLRVRQRTRRREYELDDSILPILSRTDVGLIV